MKRSKLVPVGIMLTSSLGWVLPHGATAAGPWGDTAAARRLTTRRRPRHRQCRTWRCIKEAFCGDKRLTLKGSRWRMSKFRSASRGSEVSLVTTDANGRFAVSGLNGGTYQVLAADGGGSFRLWAPDTAPPSAQAGRWWFPAARRSAVSLPRRWSS